MISLLAKLLIKEESYSKRRFAYGVLCGMVGICFNILLFAGKLAVGTVSNSIAVTADALNNLSDAASSVVALVGFKLAGTKPDTEHPFGHGRIEYVSGLIVSAAILITSFELVKSSVEKILQPEEIVFGPILFCVLLVSVLVKLYMFYYNDSIGKKIDSAAMRATAADSLSDALATSVVLASALAGFYLGYPVDGYCGVLVGIFIFYAGVSAARDTLNPLLGQPPQESFVNQIREIVTAHQGILGIHDLIVHDYGPGRQMISLHAEVSAQSDIMEIHDLIDRIEIELKEKLYCEAVIHMDPIVRDAQTDRMRAAVAEIAHQAGECFSIHDFRMVPGKTHTNLIFDLVVPFSHRQGDEEVAEEIRRRAAKMLGRDYHLKIQIDRE